MRNATTRVKSLLGSGDNGHRTDEAIDPDSGHVSQPASMKQAKPVEDRGKDNI